MENKEIIHHFLDAMIQKLKEHTSESYAVFLIRDVVDGSREKFDFSEHIKIDKKLEVNEQINDVDKTKIKELLEDIIINFKGAFPKDSEVHKYFFVEIKKHLGNKFENYEALGIAI
jgi:putative heme iron utilization protein